MKLKQTKVQPKPKPKPWRRRLAREKPSLPDGLVLDRPPRLQLNFYDQGVVKTERTARGWRSYPVSAAAMAQLLSNQPSSSGLLLPNTVATGTVLGVPFYVLYVPPRPARLLLRDQESLTIQTPPLIWAGCGSNKWRIFALAEVGFPRSAQTPLYQAPFPNTYADGSICWGSSDPRPPASPAGMHHALNIYLEGSEFNVHVAGNRSRRYQGNILLAYKQLDAETPYPLDDLVAAPYRLEWLISGQAWKERGQR